MAVRRKASKAEVDPSQLLREALSLIEEEKGISRDTMLEAIENSLLTACKTSFTHTDNIICEIDRQTCEYHLYQEKLVVQDEPEKEDEETQISLERARTLDFNAEIGGTVRIPLKSQEFGRIAATNAKNVILQKIREEERNSIYNEFFSKERGIVTGTVQRFMGRNININLGKTDAVLSENEQVKSEHLDIGDRVRVYILEVRNTPRGPKIMVSRTHPELVKRLFENEVSEVGDGTVEIRSISREPGSRTKIAVWSNNPDVDAVGSCVGMNGSRVNAIVDELKGEKIDVVNWDENPAIFIENALSPAKVVSVIVDGDEKTAKVVVPDYQLSLAIGREGQNARLAARLTGFKIDIKSETQAKDAPGFRMEDYLVDEDEEEYYEEDEEGYYEEDEEAEYSEEDDSAEEGAVAENVEDGGAYEGEDDETDIAEEPIEDSGEEDSEEEDSGSDESVTESEEHGVIFPSMEDEGKDIDE
ncbi:MAG: transcription termination/antitermination protein NusA [Lachnospiraceae bacterium]|nr:transcription termination/antitermination protein NusA [Lachnospiraceae bacterium]